MVLFLDHLEGLLLAHPMAHKHLLFPDEVVGVTKHILAIPLPGAVFNLQLLVLQVWVLQEELIQEPLIERGILPLPLWLPFNESLIVLGGGNDRLEDIEFRV